MREGKQGTHVLLRRSTVISGVRAAHVCTDLIIFCGERKAAKNLRLGGPVVIHSAHQAISVLRETSSCVCRNRILSFYVHRNSRVSWEKGVAGTDRRRAAGVPSSASDQISTA